MAQVQPVLQHPLVHLVQALALFPELARVPHQQPFAHRCGQAVHMADLSFRVFAPQIFQLHAGRLIGAAQTRGKTDVQQVFARFQQLFKNIMALARVGSGGLHRLFLPHFVVDRFDVAFVAFDIADILLPLYPHRQR